MQQKMWVKVKIAGSDFLIRHTVCGTCHSLNITDFINLWFEDIEEKSVLLRCQEMNRLVEASDEVFLGHVWSLVDNVREDVIWNFSQVDTTKVLNLQTVLEGFKFRMKFLLTPANPLKFFEEVTCPLLTMVSELEKRQRLLVDVIKRKDLEIMEYKLEGGQISRKAVETEQFDLDAFSAECARDLSTTKSCVASQASLVLTPPIQDLMDKISAAPLLPKVQTSEVMSQAKPKAVSSKPSSKHKKSVFYDDDDDDEGEPYSKKHEVEANLNQECPPSKKLLRGKAKQKVLPNL